MQNGSWRTLTLMLACLPAWTGCLEQSDREVVVYTALDREFSESILSDVGEELQLQIRPKFDQESNKTVGLANEILRRQQRPVTDLFWNNEILHTLRLQRAGLLEPMNISRLEAWPDSYRSSSDTWIGFAARARILIVNTDLVPPERMPQSIFDLADPKWKGKCAMAKPLFGTSATHAAVLMAELGVEEGQQRLAEMLQNASVVGGNKQVATGVSEGRFAFGLTDTDDAMVEIEQGKPVTIVFPDQADDQLGTLLIPNTIALIQNGPQTQLARQVLDRLVRSDIEVRLEQGSSAQLPLDPEWKGTWRVLKHAQVDDSFKRMSVDFEAAADEWDRAEAWVQQLLER